ncbi:dihydroneopterin aldolase [Peribacillus deserti]|uniref:7,8-dihydroneopterin aldolase n=1 Tax=Peribacillus deserti TaxID=673318 RepID=A0ABS2QNX0_9BACI|nr:dihydroneopterin aldolase [Peribacillus deserti]MBM7694876.1 dihydroneopterin aldolase [Peribacillus deserti]
MDKIYVKGMEFYGYHGVFAEETRLGQRFRVDLTVEADLSQAGKSDNLNDSISYAELFTMTKEVVEGTPFKLIEAVAEKVAENILLAYTNIDNCTVKVIKPDPPIPGHYEYVGVEITRGRPV